MVNFAKQKRELKKMIQFLQQELAGTKTDVEDVKEN